MARGLGLAFRQALESFVTAPQHGVDGAFSGMGTSTSSSHILKACKDASGVTCFTSLPPLGMNRSRHARFLGLPTAFPEDDDPDDADEIAGDPPADDEVDADEIGAEDADVKKTNPTGEIQDTAALIGSPEAAAAQLAKVNKDLQMGIIDAAGGLPKQLADKVENFNSIAKLAAALPVGAPLVNQTWVNMDGLPTVKTTSTSLAYVSRDIANSKESAMNPTFGCKCGSWQPALAHPEIDFRPEFLEGHPDFLRRVALLKVHLQDLTVDPTGVDKRSVHWDATYDIRRSINPDNSRLRLSSSIPALPRSGAQLRFMTFCPPEGKGDHEYSLKVTALDKDEQSIEYFKDEEVRMKATPPKAVTPPPGMEAKRIGPGAMPPAEASPQDQGEETGKQTVRRFLGGGPSDVKISKSSEGGGSTKEENMLAAGLAAGNRYNRRPRRKMPPGAPPVPPQQPGQTTQGQAPPQTAESEAPAGSNSAPENSENQAGDDDEASADKPSMQDGTEDVDKVEPSVSKKDRAKNKFRSGGENDGTADDNSPTRRRDKFKKSKGADADPEPDDDNVQEKPPEMMNATRKAEAQRAPTAEAR